jgi:multiple sugar transport system permease protein
MRKHRALPYLFLAPFFLVFATFKIAPLLYALDLSLYREALVGGIRFVGFDNYTRALADPKFWGGVQNMLLFGALQIPVMLGLALVLALALDSGLARAATFFKLALYLPYTVPTVIAALIWGYLYGPAFGPFTQAADWLGWPRPSFLSAGAMVPSLANIVTWEYTGYNMVILYSALQAVPRELEDAAAIDGASKLQFAAYVKIPMIKPALLVTLVFSVIGTFQLFNEPQLMRALAPEIIGDHYTPNIYAYTLAFVNLDYTYAAAVSFLIGAIVAGISYCFMLAGGARKDASA